VVGDVTVLARPGSAQDAPGEAAPPIATSSPAPVFQIGAGHLTLHSDDSSLSDRFRRLYGDCLVDHAPESGPRVELRIGSASRDTVSVSVAGAESVPLPEFIVAALADRGCQVVGQEPDDWHILRSESPAAIFRVRGRQVIFSAESPWRALTANIAIGLVIALQRDAIFLHASAVALGSASGVLFAGPKAAGKTTMALGLASRGHGFLGDEIVGVRTEGSELVPVLRTISKREGPCAAAVEHALPALDTWASRYPNGEVRTIIRATALFIPGHAVRLRSIVLLDGFAETPSLEPVAPSLAAASRLTPITSTLFGQTTLARAFALVRLLSSARVYALKIGAPDATASLLEQQLSE
jgi:hypothetical protein